jgi:hypothetical protein
MLNHLSLSKVIKSQAGWYRGDFHAHTNHSDGYHSPPDLVNVARAEGLDFFAITDHSSITAYPEFGAPTDMLIIPGIEVTMKTGHYNIFGLDKEVDWLADVCTWPTHVPGSTSRYNTPTPLMAHIGRDGLLVSINHPLLPPWDWLHPDTDLRHVHCLEIINDPSWPENRQANPAAIAMWTNWLNAGYRITAIGGSDYHCPRPQPGKNKPAERLGLPRTYVYADELSGNAILAGLQQRRVYVSMGPEVTFNARLNGQSYGIGADIGKQHNDITFTATITHAPRGSVAKIIKNGAPIAETAINTEPTSLKQPVRITDESAWFRLDVFDPDGAPLVVTNPIYSGPPLQPNRFTFGDFV